MTQEQPSEASPVFGGPGGGTDAGAAATSRFAVEHSFLGQLTSLAVLSPAQLQGVVSRNPELAKSHIYAVCTRPRISLPPGGFVVTDDAIRGTFRSQVQGEFKEVTFEQQNTFGVPGLRAETKWPHTEVVLLDGAGEVRSRMAASVLLAMLMAGHDPRDEAVQNAHLNFLDLHVEYIGRAYSDGGRNSLDRLQKHETLQKIQAEVAATRPDRDILLVPMVFGARSVIAEFGPWRGTASKEAELQQFRAAQESSLPEAHRVALIEGALIRYFAPTYNNQMKHTFPRPTHKDYAAVYERELIGAGFELTTLSVGTRLGSDSQPPSWAHSRVFSLRTPDEKKSLLDLADWAGA
ncbi:hypothetical protein [Kitasatospora purpeofusca]|uniref:hypothetical protein n=1 Tax=Kitasatospora purpeofusca TaxID=67352 RepID=UPI003815EB7C